MRQPIVIGKIERAESCKCVMCECILGSRCWRKCVLGIRISSFFSALWPTLPLDLNDGKTLGWRNGQWFEKTSSGHDGMTIVFIGSQRSIVNKPLSRSTLHQYLCVHHPHQGGHERVRQEMDGCVAATQEYPGTIPPKISRHYPPKRFPNPG